MPWQLNLIMVYLLACCIYIYFFFQVHKVYMQLTSLFRIKLQFVECFNLICIKRNNVGKFQVPFSLEYPLWIACELLPLAKSLKVNLMATNPTLNHKSTKYKNIKSIIIWQVGNDTHKNQLSYKVNLCLWWENSAWDGQPVWCSISSNADFVTQNSSQEVAEIEGKALDSQFTKSSNPHLYSWAVGREQQTCDPWDCPVGRKHCWEDGCLEHCS